jgi:hypothetical protein
VGREAVKIAISLGAEGFECIGSYGKSDQQWVKFGFKLHLSYGHIPKADLLRIIGGKKDESLQIASY